MGRIKWFVPASVDEPCNPFGVVDYAATLYSRRDGFTLPASTGPTDPQERAATNRAIWEAPPAGTAGAAGRAAASLDHAVTGPLELPARPLEVPAGTLLRLAADDWTGGDLAPGTQVAVVLSAVRTDPASDGWVWVIGHRPQCEYATADEHLPCLELRVRTSVLARHGCPP